MNIKRLYLINQKKNRKEIIKSVLLTLTYVLLANIFYPEVNSVVNYMWKLTLNFNYYEFVINSLLIILIYICIPTKEDIAYFTFSIVLLFIYIPITVLINYTNFGLQYSFLFFGSFLISLITYKFLNKLPLILPQKKISIKLISNVLVFYSLLLGLYVVIKFDILGGISFVFNNVYDIRGNVSYEGIEAYLIRGYISLISPLLIGFGVYYKKFFLILLAVIVNVLLFVTFAMKIYFLYLILAIGLSFSFMYFKKISKIMFPLYALLVILLSKSIGVIIYPYVDRFLYLPALLNILHFDFFSSNPYNFFYGSRIGTLFQIQNYIFPMGYIIDSNYFGGGMNANTGYIATAFGELGYIGVFIASILFGFIVRIISIGSRKNKFIGFSAGTLYVFELMNASIFSLFLTNFFIIYMIIIYFVEFENSTALDKS